MDLKSEWKMTPSNLFTLVGLIGALVGFLLSGKLDTLWPWTLTYTAAPLNCEGAACEFDVRISNEGWFPQKEVKFELPHTLEPHDRIWSDRNYKLGTDGVRPTIELGVIHPGKTRRIAIYYPKGTAEILTREFLGIYSSDSEASYSGPSEYALPWWYTYAMGTCAALVVLGALFRIFESKASRYIRLLHLLDRRMSEHERTRRSISKIKAQLAEIPASAIAKAEADAAKTPRFFLPSALRR